MEGEAAPLLSARSGFLDKLYLQKCFISFNHYSSMALRHFVGPWPLLQFRNLFTQTVLLLERVISPSQGRCLHTGQHKINAHGHPCLEWDSNPRSQRSSERRQFMPSMVRPL
jgi:hypothetical protein